MHRALLVLPSVLLVLIARPVQAASPSPLATPTAPLATPAASPSAAPPTAPLPTTTSTRIVASASPTPRVAAATQPQEAPAAAAANEIPAAVAPTVLVRPRAFRTPEREAPPAFVAPQGDTGDGNAADLVEPAERGPAVGSRPPARSAGSLVVFRMTARTALEGFDLRVAYPTVVGTFGTAARPAECNAGTGTLVVANDRGAGELRVLVASAQALPFPLDVFCRFTPEPGAGLDAGALDVHVAEVTSNGRRADPSLLLVNVVVR